MPKSGPIIIIEDEKEDQELLKDAFEELEVRNSVQFFDTGLSALQYLLNSVEKPFLILADIYLPGMSGIDLLRRVREHERLQNRCIPFIFFTSGANRLIIEQAYQQNAQGVFIKPLTSEQLQKSLNAIINYWKFARLPGSI